MDDLRRANQVRVVPTVIPSETRETNGGRDAFDTMLRQLSGEQERVAKLLEQVRRMEHERDVYAERVKESATENSHLQSVCASLRDSAYTKDVEMQLVSSQLSSKAMRCAELEALLAEAMNHESLSYGTASLSAEHSQESPEVAELNRALSRVSELEAQLQEALEREKYLIDHQQGEQSARESDEDRVLELEEQLSSARAQASGLRDALATSESAAGALHARVTELEASLTGAVDRENYYREHLVARGLEGPSAGQRELEEQLSAALERENYYKEALQCAESRRAEQHDEPSAGPDHAALYAQVAELQARLTETLEEADYYRGALASLERHAETLEAAADPSARVSELEALLATSRDRESYYRDALAATEGRHPEYAAPLVTDLNHSESELAGRVLELEEQLSAALDREAQLSRGLVDIGAQNTEEAEQRHYSAQSEELLQEIERQEHDK